MNPISYPHGVIGGEWDNAVLMIWSTVLATVTTVSAKIKLLLFLSLDFFLLHQVVSSCCLASSRSQAGSLSARILSAFVFYGFTDQIMFLQKVLPRAISAVLCLLLLHHLSAFLWSDPVWYCWMWGALTVQSASGKGQWRKKIQRDSALWMVDMVQECRGKTCYKSLCEVKWLRSRYHHISFTFFAFQRYTSQASPFHFFSCALDVNVPWWPPLMKDWAQQLLMVLRAVCMSEVSKSSQLTSVSSCRLMKWFVSMRYGCWASHCLVIMGSLLQRNSHFLAPISSQKPWYCRRSRLHVVP